MRYMNETDNCAPSECDIGKYIMYPWAVDGYDKNNLVSPVKYCINDYKLTDYGKV